jgi:hypothetical protein
LQFPAGTGIRKPLRQPQRAKPGAGNGCDPQPGPSRSNTNATPPQQERNSRSDPGNLTALFPIVGGG